MASPRIEEWSGSLYPDFVGEGRNDQEAIMGAICALKKASFNGVDCVGEDAEANGTVKQTSRFETSKRLVSVEHYRIGGCNNLLFSVMWSSSV